MTCHERVRSFDRPASRWLAASAAGLMGLLIAAPASAQSYAPSGDKQPMAGMEEAANDMAALPGMKNAPMQRRMDAVTFIAGNMLFVLLHETGHALVTEMGLPVLGREEDAADGYATTTMLKMGTGFSHRVLTEAAKGWFLAAERNQRRGSMPMYYDEHGLDWQRAYQIICLMVGSDPDQFKQLADWVQMPEERQDTCGGDYSNAKWSWDTVLKSHLRAPDQDKVKINVEYGEAKGKLEVYAKAFRAVGLLEAVADYNADKFVWRSPYTMEIKTCGMADAHWDLSARKLHICYELAEEFLQTYQDVGTAPPMANKMAPNDILARNIRRLRLQHGMSMDKLAQDSGLAKAWMGRMEAGQEIATPSQIDKLARAFHMQSNELVALASATETPPRGQVVRRLKKQ